MRPERKETPMSKKLESLSGSNAPTCSRLARCSACGRITNDYVMYGSLFLTDEYPSQCPHVCGSECMATAADKIESGEWEVPVLRKAHGGYCHDISKPRKGYDAQPDQATLVNALIHAANVRYALTGAIEKKMK